MMFSRMVENLYLELSREYDGLYEKGSLMHSPKVKIKHHNWTIYIDTITENYSRHSIRYTRLRSCVNLKHNINFKIVKKNFMRYVENYFSDHSIELGKHEFDVNYYVYGNNEDLIKTLLNETEMLSAIISIPKLNLLLSRKTYHHGKKCLPNEGTLSYFVPGVIDDELVLKRLIWIYQNLLDRMYKWDIIGEDDGKTVL